MKLGISAMLLLALGPLELVAGPILLGGVGRGSSANAGSLIRIDSTTGAGTVIGNPDNLGGLTGLIFDMNGVLWGTTITGSPFEAGESTLVRIDPGTGGQIGSALPITSDGKALAVNDLAAQPGTGLLFGTVINLLTFSSNLYNIDKETGEATYIGDTGIVGATLAFAPDGTLYQTSAEFSAPGVFVRGFLNTLDPTNAAVLDTFDPFTSAHVGGLAVRSDGVIFASGNQSGGIYTVPLGGELALLGSTGAGAPGDIAFVIPEPGAFGLFAISLGALLYRRRPANELT